jgi:hypothetical protein
VAVTGVEIEAAAMAVDQLSAVAGAVVSEAVTEVVAAVSAVDEVVTEVVATKPAD